MESVLVTVEVRMSALGSAEQAEALSTVMVKDSMAIEMAKLAEVHVQRACASAMQKSPSNVATSE